MPRPLLAACLSLLAASAGAQAVPAIPDLPPASAAARRRTPPSRDSLDGIASRGRLLADYDRAGWHASDAVQALPNVTGVAQYVALPDGDGWTVSFGRLSPRRDRFVVAYEARATSAQPTAFTVAPVSPPRADAGDVAAAARALEVAGTAFRATFTGVRRPYNPAVLRNADGSWFVYLVPAQTQAGVFPVGADVRFHVSADGRTILARRQLHNALMEHAPRPPQQNEELHAGYSIAVLDDVPEDTDVFHVLVREPKVPQYIVSDAFVYRITPDGTVTYLGRRDEVLGR